MDNPDGMCRRERVGDLRAIFPGIGQPEFPARQKVLEGTAADQFHGDVIDAIRRTDVISRW